ncbi:YqaJ viral recombinase family protein [Lysinibacillus agricola]|uniref:YqaJ viral recombinase family protein n=1 Tax=Lysinibacillus agricola TaxID=2590012 RepID=A0ABX7ATF4_9BACI|nr:MULTISPECIES: YqaJ viral recombinase family protein [Lysinibacillus]KOS61708.1 endonuclease [Lysinibacillus sp. FJAT-14222]QQP13030.1 YqaJ viral recombinase family protein [Lysinibacillus agricola]
MFQTDDKNVTENRRIFVGGSDVPIILGLSKYKSQFELAKEKTGIVPTVFEGNEYTVYGQTMEPQIRDYINVINETNFRPDTVINKESRIRGNCDGADYDESLLLEIKTHGKKPTMDVYKVQMQLYMNEFNLPAAWLALYERPENFDAEFDPERLKIEVVHRDESQINEILQTIELFWKRCEALKQHHEMTEAEFYSITLKEQNEIAIVAQQVERLENEIFNLKSLEAEYKDMKQKLYGLMIDQKVKSFETDRLTITAVLPTTSTKEVIDIAAFKEAHPRIAKKIIEEKTSNRAGYVLIKPKKEAK